MNDDFDRPELLDPDWQKQRRRARSRRLAFIAAALVLVAGAAYGLYQWRTQSSGATSAHLDLTRPFDNTPAQNWADGMAGITAPEPAKAGDFSAEQVADALGQVNQAIAVAHLDQDTLVGHKPDKYLALLAPFAREDVRTQPAPPLVYLQTGYHLLSVSPRMNGTLTVHPGGEGELVVHATYVVAYAFDPGSHVVYGPDDIESFVRVETDYVLRSGSSWEQENKGLGFENYQSFYTHATCHPQEEDALAPAYSNETPVTTSVPGQPGEFDPAQPVPTVGNCTPA